MRKAHLAVIALAAWLFIVAAFMLLAGRVDLEIFFVLWLIGTLVVVELTDTRFVQPRPLRYMKFMIAAGIVLFGAIVAQKVLEILSR